MIDLLIWLFAIIGVLFVLKVVVFPLIRVLLYAIGYVLFRVWNWNMEKLKKLIKKHGYVLFIKHLWHTFMDGLIGGLNEGFNEEHSVSSENYVKIWKPLFHYEKIKKQDLSK